MKKYKVKTRVGQEVTKIEINIRSNTDKYNSTSLYKEGVHINTLKIVYQTDRKIALNDNWITTLDRQKVGERKSEHWHYLEDIHVTIKTRETYFPNGIFGTIYTLEKQSTAINKLVKEMQLKVDKEYGFLSRINIESVVNDFLGQ
jgi:hypothetical protein